MIYTAVCMKKLLPLLALPLLGAGCLPVSILRSAIEGATKDDAEEVSADYGDDTVDYSDDYAAEESVTVPTDFPYDVPLYENGTVVSADTDATSAWATVVTDDDLTSVSLWYQSELSYKGWEYAAAEDEDGVSTTLYTQGTNSLGLALSESEGMVVINITKIKGGY
jgi:hypothetical protein